MKRHFLFPPPKNSVVHRNIIVVPLVTQDDITDQHNQQGDSTSRVHVPPLLPPPKPPQIPHELLALSLPPPPTQQTENQVSNEESNDDDSESVGVTRDKLKTLQINKLMGYVLAEGYIEERRLKTELEEVTESSKKHEVDKKVLKDLLDEAQAEILAQKNKIIEISKVREQQEIWQTKYEKLSETYTSAKDELRDKDQKIKNLDEAIKQTIIQLEDQKSKVRNLEVSEKKLKNELKEKSKEYINLESEYNAKCAELKCKSEDMINYESKFSIKCTELKQKEEDFAKLESKYAKKCTKLKKLSADLIDETNKNKKLKEKNGNLEKKIVNLNGIILKKDEEILKLTEGLNCVKKANQNIMGESNKLGKKLPDIFYKVREKFNLKKTSETQSISTTTTYSQVFQAGLKECAAKNNLEKGVGGGDESEESDASGDTEIVQRIENNAGGDNCEVNQDVCLLSKKSPAGSPMLPTETPKGPENKKRKTSEFGTDPDPVNDNDGNKGRPKIILKISKKLKLEKNN